MKKKNLNYFTYKIKYHLYNQLSIKKYIYTTLNLYIHPAETHRLLKFLFHRMGRLVPAHNQIPPVLICQITMLVKDKTGMNISL